MLRIALNAFPCVVPFRASLCSICHASLPVRACVSFQESTCAPYATHHAQCVSGPRLRPSSTSRTICHAARPIRFRASSLPSVTLRTTCPTSRCNSVNHIAYHISRITLNAFPCIVPFRASLCRKCHAALPMRACVAFQDSTCVPYATHPAVHHLECQIPRITPLRECVSFQDSICVPYVTHHAKCVSVQHLLSNITL